MKQKDLCIAMFKGNQNCVSEIGETLNKLYKSSEIKNYSCFNRLLRYLRKNNLAYAAVLINLDNTSKRTTKYIRKIRQKNPDIVISAFSEKEDRKIIRAFYVNGGNIFFVSPSEKSDKEKVLLDYTKIIIKSYMLNFDKEYMIFRLH